MNMGMAALEYAEKMLRTSEENAAKRCPPGCPKCAAEYLDAKEREEQNQESRGNEALEHVELASGL